MKIRIGNIWYSSDDIPILLEFDDQEWKETGSTFKKMAAFPDSMYFTEKEKQDFLDGEMIRIGG